MAPALTRLAAAGVAALAAAAAGAEAWQADAGDGALEFTATQAGGRFTGHFRAFAVELDFDPADPAAARLAVTVETGSVDTQDDERDGILRSRDFFWSERHPAATWRTEGFERVGDGWRARGSLALRGETRPVAVRFSLAREDGVLAMRGAAEIRRLAFGVGQGDWSSTEWIGDTVGIAFDLRLRPAGSAASP